MITVHHLENSRSQRVLWLLEELGLGYEVKRYARNPKTMLAPPELRQVHPLGKSPVITDGPVTVAETGAIVDYLIGTYADGALIPPAGSPERRRYDYWMHYAEGSAMPPLVMKLVFSALPKAPGLPALLRPIARMIAAGAAKSYIDPEVRKHVAFWDTELANSAYFAGPQLTGADIMMSFPLEAAQARGGLTPRLTEYLSGLHARPAYQAALRRGGPYSLRMAA